MTQKEINLIEETIKKYVGSENNPLTGHTFSEILDMIKEGKV